MFCHLVQVEVVMFCHLVQVEEVVMFCHLVQVEVVMFCHLVQVEVVLWVACQPEPVDDLRTAAGQQLVEHVEVALPARLVDHARLLQQVVQDVTTHRSSL